MEKNSRFPVLWKDGRKEGRRGIQLYGEEQQVPCVVEGQKIEGSRGIYIYMEKNTRFPVQQKDRRQERNIYIWRRILGSLCSGRIEGRRGIYIYGEEQQVPSSGRIEGRRGIYIYINGEEQKVPCVVEGQKVGEEYIYMEKNTRFPVQQKGVG